MQFNSVGIKFAIEYLFPRIKKGGDSFQACQVYYASYLWNIFYAKDSGEERDHNLARNICFACALGRDEMINSLKYSFIVHKDYVSALVVKNPLRIMKQNFNFF